MGAIINEKGNRFGKLVVMALHHSNNGAYWLCACDCGTESVVKASSLRKGTTRSCGCGSVAQARANVIAAAVARRTPVECPRKLKDLYRNMLDRCYNPSNRRWADYGGRGIKVCKEWRDSRAAFYRWAIANGIRFGVQIDRINNSRGYSPSNCRFVDAVTQANNTRKNVWLTWGGERKTIAQWSVAIGITYRALQHRVDRGWTRKRIFTQPYRKGR